ncbi:MAG: hypothetical protein JNL28_14895 [Planctomycetes bacterium]|nr:hypothetical protein [Planctomycetota bacterium]
MIFLSLSLAALMAPPAAAAGVPVTFKGKSGTTEQLPAGLSPDQVAIVARYAPWASGAGYRMDFDAQGRILLVTHKNRSRLQDTLRTIGKAQTWFDGVLPAPERKVQPETPVDDKPAPPAPEPLPEDPESKALRQGTGTPAAPDSPGTKTTWQTSWGTGSIEPDTQIAALFIVKTAEDYSTLLDVLASETHYLKHWIDDARKHTGFTIEDPLAGAYQENAAGQEEWNGDHELINRTVQLMTLRRFGQQPNWIVQGIAWDGEIAADGLVYCFPFRSEFVFAAEHGAWPNEAKALVKDLGRTLELSDVANWKRGTWKDKPAKLAWGTVHHLIGQGPGPLSNALEDMRLMREKKDRRTTGPNSWERIPGFELSAEDQTAILQARFGPDVLKDITNSVRSGRVSVRKDPKPGTKNSAGRG